MAPSSYQAPRSDGEGKKNMSQDARLAFEKAYSETKVGEILNEKGHQIFAITSSMTLSAAVAELAARKIGNMPVIDTNGGLVGVLSERDIVRATAEIGEEALTHSVSAYMTENPKTCSSDALIVNVMQEMTDGHFRHMPVVDGTRLAGVISIRDIVLHRVTEVEYENLRLKQLMVG
ncbi:CBS domain-containing protein [Cohaesibacter celericrescens]|nr:CBS domain-containing protein [Cohaesibacter celericrescens]